MSVPLTRNEAVINMGIQLLRVWLPKSHGIAFSADHFGAKMFERLALPEPPDGRLLGLIFLRAQKEGLVRKLVIDGTVVTVLTRSKHRSPLWMAA